ncbi:MAG: manganese efflux pump [Oscillospiraceae bacterium]|nr:manganese efflux pump [Oscillospiraceae bacterium]
MTIAFLLTNILLGAGLAMDAFTVSLANGLNDPKMRRSGAARISGVFAGFQAAMPLLGWFCVRTVAEHFRAFEKMIPWIALILLAAIGGKMVIEGLRSKSAPETETTAALGLGALLLQGIATSIDALSVGFTIADYDLAHALGAAFIIAAVTFAICMAGIQLGRKFGMKLAGKATVLGGLLLIGIGLEIFISHMVG